MGTSIPLEGDEPNQPTNQDGEYRETKPSLCYVQNAQDQVWVDLPGFPSVTDIMFRHHTELVHRKAQRKTSRYFGDVRISGQNRRVTELSTPLLSRATTFFLHHYVFAARANFDTGPPKGVHEFLPVLLRNAKSTSALGTIVSAAGLAALANACTSVAWKYQAYRLYGEAIQQLQSDIKDPHLMKSDDVLATVLLMGTFEMISAADPMSLESFTKHVVAGAQCVQMRGPTQFRGEVPATLFTQMRRLIVMSCHQMQEPLPYGLKIWSSWAAPAQRRDEASLNLFSELNEQLAAVRSEIKHKGITNPSTIIELLSPIDFMLEDWSMKLPDSWAFKSYRALPSETSSDESCKLQYDMYPDLWVASMWNNYRMDRIMIHETIIGTALKYGSEKERNGLQYSRGILKEMANGVFHSVPYTLGHQRGSLSAERDASTRLPDGSPLPGGYLLVWPLFLAGSVTTTPPDLRKWASVTLQDIGLRTGMQLALSMAKKLEQTHLSFLDKQIWLVGEFYPS
ncbi:Transcription factor dbaG-like protein [Cladobotryum mycophilum]|uniref:Transcription factor dbaG-like protein n=1 Tax=Cladobotryum mycophilum TaxID=491253 RepID=A0ABR0SWX7_9HYPO